MKKVFRPISIMVMVVFCSVMIFSGCGISGSNAAGTTNPAASTGSAAAPGTAAGTAADKQEILIGYVAPFTGPLSVFTVAFEWVKQISLDKINAEGGIYIEKYGKKLPVRVITGDSESDPTKASEIATKFVLENKVDILCGAWTPDTTNPVSAVAERYKIPALMSNSPADSWLTGGPYEWSCGVLFYVDGFLSDYVDAIDKLDTNKKVGYILDSEVDGVTFSAKLNTLLPKRGYEVVDPGRFPMNTTDYTSIITKLKDADVDIVIGNQITPNFTTFWQQCQQLGFIPKVVIIGKAEHFESDVIALGNGIGTGLMSEVLWDESFPFTSPLIKMSCQEITDKWETEKGTQYPATIGYDVSFFEVLNDALGRCADLEPATVIAALLATDMDSIYGHISFDENHVASVPCVTGQWIKGEKYEFEKIIVGTGSFPTIPSVQPQLLPGFTTGKK